MTEPPLITRKTKTPGPLRSNSHLVIHTRQAQRLVEGRSEPGKPPIFGMLSFGRKMRSVWLSSEHDDPYADWYLLQVEAAIGESHSLLQQNIRDLCSRISATPSVHIDISISGEPITVPLAFANPYGYMGAYLVADFDELARLVLTARHVGLIDRKYAETLLQTCATTVRRSFHKSTQWQYSGVTRDDVRSGTAVAKKAADLMGPLPAEYLSLAVRAKCAPAIRKAEPLLASSQKPHKVPDEESGSRPNADTISDDPSELANQNAKQKAEEIRIA